MRIAAELVQKTHIRKKLNRDEVIQMERQNQEKNIEVQINKLSDNLTRKYRIDEIFFPVLVFLVGIVTATIFYLFIFQDDSTFHLLVLYSVTFCILVTGYIILHTQHKSFPMKIFYTP